MPSPPCTPPALATSPLKKGRLQTTDGHDIAWSEHGVPEGLPVLVLHGGPGSGSSLRHVDFFPLDRCRVVLMDQRGCGQSTPLGSLADNTTAHLLQDIEDLRQHLGIDAWLVVGGSWGATLALAYVQRAPDACSGVLLRAPFLPNASNLDWFCWGAGQLRPQAHADFIRVAAAHSASPPTSVEHVLAAYAQAFARNDLHALHQWLNWEATLEQPLNPSPTAPPITPERLPFLQARSRIQLHYLTQGCFLNITQLLTELSACGHVPCAIVQGDLDWICPPTNAWQVQQAWPGAKLYTVPQGTHSPFEGMMPLTTQQLVEHFLSTGHFPSTLPSLST